MKLAFWWFVLAVAAAGCAPVKPYQREYLSLRPMRPTSRRRKIASAATGSSSREGSEGGFGAAGGGCGCN